MNRISKSINKIKSFLVGLIKTEKVIPIQKSQIQLPKSKQVSDGYIKGSVVEYLETKGIPSKNTTHLHIGQTRLVFNNRIKSTEIHKEDEASKGDDSIGASLRYLKYQRLKNK